MKNNKNLEVVKTLVELNLRGIEVYVTAEGWKVWEETLLNLDKANVSVNHEAI